MKHPLSNSLTHQFQLLLCAFVSLCLCVETAHADEYTKIGIVTGAKAAGRWDALKYWISEAGLSDEWDAAAYIPSDHPGLAMATNAIVAAGVATAEEVAAILDAARDTSVSDALLTAVYEREIATASGRVKWHGKVVSQEIVTNEAKKISYHADGWTFEEPFRLPSPKAQKITLAKSGIPKALAAARTRRERETDAPVETNVTITISNGETRE